MYFLGLGVALLLLKVFEVSWLTPVSWWWVAAPFALAVTWWAWADSSGYTKRKAMERENQKTAARRQRTKEALGTINRSRR